MKIKQLILSTVALAVATSFVSNSALAVTADDVICSSCVNTPDIANGAVTAVKLRAGAVRTVKIEDNAVTTAKIASGAVISGKIASNSINTSKIINGEVKTLDIANGAVTAVKLRADAVKTAKIQDGAVTSAKIADGTVTGADIANGSITGTDIATNSVTSSDVSGLFDIDIVDEAGLEYFQDTFVVGTVVSVTGTWTAVRTLFVTAPTSGYVTCNAVGHIDVDISSSTGQVNFGWDINNSTAGTAPDSFNRYRAPNVANDYIPYSAAHTYSVGAGTSTYSFKVHTSGTDTAFDMNLMSYTCMFFPTRY